MGVNDLGFQMHDLKKNQGVGLQPPTPTFNKSEMVGSDRVS